MILTEVSQNNIHIQILSITHGGGGAFQSLIVPGIYIVCAHFLADHIITVGEFVVAGEVHDVIAVLSCNDTGIANLAAGVNTPVQEVGNIVGLGMDVLVKTAVLLGSIILGMLLDQFNEGLFGLFAGFPFLQQFFSLSLSLFLFSIRVGLSAVGGSAAAFKGNQQMADICQLLRVFVARLEDNNGITGGSLDFLVVLVLSSGFFGNYGVAIIMLR